MNKFSYIVWLRGSLDNSKDGASGKKMAAFYVITALVTPMLVAWAIWAFIKNDWALMPSTLNSLLFFAGSALTINGVEKIIDKIKTNKDDKTTPPDTSDTPAT